MPTAAASTIMVIQSDPRQLAQATTILEEDGCNVLACANAEEALSLLCLSTAVDVIITDLIMPHIHGWHFCRLLRSPAFAAYNHVPILVVSTAFAEADTGLLTEDLGVRACLAAPYRPETLRTAVRACRTGDALPVAQRVLLMTVDAQLIATLRTAFVQQGYGVQTARTADEGRWLLQEYRPDLVLLDQMFPETIVEQLLRSAKRLLPALVVVMLTADLSPQCALQFLQQGADGYASKPVDTAALLQLCTRLRREGFLIRREALLATRARDLQASEAQFRQLFDSIPDAALVHDAMGTILAINATGAHWLEWPAEALRGQPLSVLLAPDVTAPLVGTAPAEGAPPLQTQTAYVSRTGRRMTVEVTERPITFGGIAAALSIVRDVTEREQIVMALQASKEYAENIIASSLDIIVSVDTHRQITAFNQAAQEAFGYSLAEVLGQRVDILYAVPETGEHIYRTLIQVGRFSGEVLNKRQDGTCFETYLSASVLRDGTGQVIGVMGVSHDITERKRAERSLQAAKEAAEEANRSKSAFLANVSHEVRTPLNGILGMTDLALHTDLTTEQREYLDLVKVSADALLEVISDLLDVSKIEAGKLTLQAQAFDFYETLHETLKTLAIPAHQKGLELLYEIRPEVPPWLVGDAVRLRQILLNLVGNAIKFTPQGDVILRAEILAPFANESGATDPNAPSQVGSRVSTGTCIVHVSVSDTGIGIPTSQQRMIFEPFVQADGSTTRHYGGTGLGLSIASQLVTLMGGHIWVESTVGVGSTFHFTARFTVPTGSPVPAYLTETLPALPILLVTTHLAQAQMLSDVLARWHLYPTVMSSTKEAMHALVQAEQAQQPFVCVLLDLSPAAPQDCELLVWLRRQPYLAATPVLPLTMATHAGAHEVWRTYGVTTHLTKPVSQAALWEALTQVCSGVSQDAAAHLVTYGPHEPTTDPLRILLADDNLVQQQLARRLLEKRGHDVTTVADGTAAIAIASRQPFDVLLLDIQMPSLNGFEVTAALRERERQTGQHLPIVAMTAYVMPGDRERCLDAGMDAYIGKPLHAEELFRTLAALAPVPPQQHAGEWAVDPTVWDRQELLTRVEGDTDLLQELLRLFLADYPSRLEELRGALARADSTALTQTAHALKGALSNISAPTATAAALRIESCGHAKHWEDAPAALQSFEAELARLLPLILPIAQAPTGSARLTPPGDRATTPRTEA